MANDSKKNPLPLPSTRERDILRKGQLPDFRFTPPPPPPKKG